MSGWSGRLKIRREVLCLCCSSWKWCWGWKEILCSPVVELRAQPVLELTSVELTLYIGAHQSFSNATPFLFLHCPLSPESISHQMVDFSRYNPTFSICQRLIIFSMVPIWALLVPSLQLLGVWYYLVMFDKIDQNILKHRIGRRGDERRAHKQWLWDKV